MFRQFTALLMALTLCFTTVSCGSNSSKVTQSQQPTTNSSPAVNTPALANGRYPVQQATYNDADGTYSLMLLNTPPGTPPQHQVTNLQMARLTDEQIAQGEQTYLEVNGDTQVMYLTEDFKIEYIHNVTETRENPQTGQTETVVVRQQSNFWSPFAGALAGQAIGSLLFRPQYYVPPAFSPGGMTGFGGYGSTYNGAVERYRTTYNAPPAAVRNREVFRTTGGLRTPSTTVRQPSPATGTRSTGSGYGTSRLKTGPSPSTTKPRSGFGTSSGARRTPSRSFRRR
ncbi:hypothetical protein C7H19_12190 [Aphanothece hegewaldii CCALA 016]|uniref:DUF1190 domain-containing protein n=1 Tax=Aphanothece hegewaldii CCALA 016 TaxID=2107694 RepID=A0A2T1LX03_9CHRO|nr:hypothetical protein [Aphanothece hegewaldii]PSF36727.1 hypothetical protein C7H19_12190 [Aphanothece hegewaldii CCALA 016]